MSSSFGYTSTGLQFFTPRHCRMLNGTSIHQKSFTHFYHVV